MVDNRRAEPRLRIDVGWQFHDGRWRLTDGGWWVTTNTGWGSRRKKESRRNPPEGPPSANGAPRDRQGPRASDQEPVQIHKYRNFFFLSP